MSQNRLLNVLVAIVFIILFIPQWVWVYTTNAQAPIELKCGESMESVFTSNLQIHKYTVNATNDISLILIAKVNVSNYEKLTIDMGLWAPNGHQIDSLWDCDRDISKTITAYELSVNGEYNISIQGFTDTGGSYVITVNCLHKDGTVLSGTNLVNNIQCGSVMNNTVFMTGEIHYYYVFLKQGDKVKFQVTSLAENYEDLTLDIGLWAPNGFQIDSLWDGDRDQTKMIETLSLSSSGVYALLLQGWTSTSSDYQLMVTCTLADGTVVNPGDNPPIDLTQSNANSVTPPETQAIFSGNGFPGLAPVNFANVAKIPIPMGIPMTGAITPTGDEIIGYVINGNEGDIVKLDFSRLSGNLNLGLVVLSSQNDIIFQASMVTGNTLNTQFTLPSTGEYTAGVFRLDLLPPSTPEATAFQLTAVLNP